MSNFFFKKTEQQDREKPFLIIPQMLMAPMELNSHCYNIYSVLWGSYEDVRSKIGSNNRLRGRLLYKNNNYFGASYVSKLYILPFLTTWYHWLYKWLLHNLVLFCPLVKQFDFPAEASANTIYLKQKMTSSLYSLRSIWQVRYHLTSFWDPWLTGIYAFRWFNTTGTRA